MNEENKNVTEESQEKQKVYDFCSPDETMNADFWRNAFLTEICDMHIPEGIDVVKLTAEQKSIIENEDYNEPFERLLILFGAGYIDFETLKSLSEFSEKYADVIREMEDCVISQSVEPEENQVSREIMRSVLECVINSRKYKEIQQIGFKTGRVLYKNQHTQIKNGFVFVRNKDFLTLLLNVGESTGHLNGEGIEVFNSERSKQDFVSEQDKDKPLDAIINDSGDKLPDMPFLVNLRNIEQIIAVYDKQYAVEFINYAKENGIPFDGNFRQRYSDYVRENKMEFTVAVISRKRNICGDTVNWFDYGAAEYEYKENRIKLGNDFDKTVTFDLSKYVGEDERLTDSQLIRKAAEKYFEENPLPDRTVIEITYSGKKYLFVKFENGKIAELESDSFRIVPFNYNNLWTIIMEWSRSRKIVKRDNQVVIPKEEWERIPENERDYAKRLIEEQYAMRHDQNKMLQKLSELKDYAEKKADAKAKRTAGQDKIKADREKGVETNENSDS